MVAFILKLLIKSRRYFLKPFQIQYFLEQFVFQNSYSVIVVTSLKNEEWKSSFFNVVAGPTLETLILISNSFTGIFFKVFKLKCRTAIPQISFLETMYFEMPMEIAKFSEKLRYHRTRAKGEQNKFF